MTWPEKCEHEHCDHSATIRIESSDGSGVCYCICHAFEDIERLHTAYRRRLALEAEGAHPRIAIARALNEFYADAPPKPSPGSAGSPRPAT